MQIHIPYKTLKLTRKIQWKLCSIYYPTILKVFPKIFFPPDWSLLKFIKVIQFSFLNALQQHCLIQGWWMNCPLKFVLKSVIITAFSRCQNFVLNFFHFLFSSFPFAICVFNYFENWRSASQNKKTLQVYIFKSHKTCNSQTKSWLP